LRATPALPVLMTAAVLAKVAATARQAEASSDQGEQQAHVGEAAAEVSQRECAAPAVDASPQICCSGKRHAFFLSEWACW